MVIGKIGARKNTLINRLFKDELTETGLGGSTTSKAIKNMKSLIFH